ncbi:MAG: hypothetical protein KAJ49_07710, partial [Arcobacteraceae bacterium]|nr:hypothetical protein [Arcobacteraceae bacterium]
TLIYTILLSISLEANQTPWDQKLPHKNMTINYKLEGTMNGTKTLYIKDFGRVSAQYKEISYIMFDLKRVEKELTITTPKWVYDIDLIANKGTKQVNIKQYLKKEFNKLSLSNQTRIRNNLNSLSFSLSEYADSVITKNEQTILGYKCEKLKRRGVTIYSIENLGLPLKHSSQMMGIKVVETATKITTNTIESSKFDIPNIKFITRSGTDDMTKLEAKDIINKLLETN